MMSLVSKTKQVKIICMEAIVQLYLLFQAKGHSTSAE